MKVKHVFGGHIYLISNYGVARNPIFKEKSDVEFFKENMNKYLGEICDIYAYAHDTNQFQYLIKVKERPVLESFFFKKQAINEKNISHNLFGLKAQVPPDSYLIFSQEVSNCLNSYAKKFNFKYKRKGSLFGDRYQKLLVESEDEMEMWIEKLNNLEKLVSFSEDWQVKQHYDFGNENGECSSGVYYEEGGLANEHCVFDNFIMWITNNMRGCFDSLPPASVKALDFNTKLENFTKIKGLSPPW